MCLVVSIVEIFSCLVDSDLQLCFGGCNCCGLLECVVKAGNCCPTSQWHTQALVILTIAQSIVAMHTHRHWLYLQCTHTQALVILAMHTHRHWLYLQCTHTGTCYTHTHRHWLYSHTHRHWLYLQCTHTGTGYTCNAHRQALVILAMHTHRHLLYSHTHRHWLYLQCTHTQALVILAMHTHTGTGYTCNAHTQALVILAMHTHRHWLYLQCTHTQALVILTYWLYSPIALSFSQRHCASTFYDTFCYHFRSTQNVFSGGWF